MRNTIVLTGMMGSGKTILGKSLAKQLDIEFFDTDKEIEKYTKMGIQTIFEKKGEQYFRKIEEKICCKVINNNEKKIVALGGGAFLNIKIRENILKNSLSIWIDTDLDTIVRRIKSSKNIRPMLDYTKLKKSIEHTLKDRRSIYKLADIRISTLEKSKLKIISEIKKYL